MFNEFKIFSSITNLKKVFYILHVLRKNFSIPVILFLLIFAFFACGDNVNVGDSSGGGGNPIETTYTVTFESNGGSAVTDITGLESGDTISPPEEPTITLNNLNQGRFRGWFTDNNTFKNLYNFSTPITNSITLYADWGYRIGDTGPGGGIICHRNNTGFNLYIGSTPADNSYVPANYLEVAPAGQGSLMWASSASPAYTNIVSSTWSDIGRGRKNTNLILAIDPNAPAAKACKDYGGGGKNDWFLPSKNELNEIFANIVYQKTGHGFIIDYYWSSSQSQENGYDYTEAFRMDFNYGTSDSFSKSTTCLIRAVRAF